MAKTDPGKLKDLATTAAAKGKYKKALGAYLELEKLESKDGNWPRRVGEMYRHMGDEASAVAAFERACDRYAEAGFVVKAVAVCKMILRMVPEHTSSKQRLVELNAERGIGLRPAAHPETPARSPEAQPEALPYQLAPDQPLEMLPLGQVVPGSVQLTKENGDPSGVIEIPIDLDLELEETQGAEVGAEVRGALEETPLFSALSPASLDQLIEQVALVDLPAGQRLFHQGDVGDTLYVVSDGSVAVYLEGPPRVRLSTLEEGAFFGEIALVTEQPRSATIEAEQDCQLLAIDRKVIAALIRDEPDVLRVLLRFLRMRLVDTLIHTSQLFAPFAGEERTRLAGRFSFLEVEKGAELVQQDALADGLFVALSGRLAVVRDDGGIRSELAELGPGDVFGEMSLLTHSGAVATVSAVTKCLLLCLPTADFRELIMTHPQVLAFVGDLAAEREQQIAAVIGGDQQYEELHLDLL